MKVSISEQLKDYKNRLEAVALQAAELPAVKAKLSEVEAEKATLEAAKISLESEKAELETIKATLETEKAALAAEVEAFKVEKADVETRAFQMISELGVNVVPKIQDEVEEKDSAEAITKKYLSLKGMEQAKYFAEHKDTILNGYRAA